MQIVDHKASHPPNVSTPESLGCREKKEGPATKLSICFAVLKRDLGAKVLRQAGSKSKARFRHDAKKKSNNLKKRGSEKGKEARRNP